MKIQTQLLWGIFFLTFILLIETYTDIDIWVQNFFFDSAKQDWLITHEMHLSLSLFFYKGIKAIIIATGVISFLYVIVSFIKPQHFPHRKFALLLCLSIIFVPVVVAGSKHITNVYCPYQIQNYGGKYPFVRVIEPYPADFQQTMRGKCFPAGHATVGFSLMMLYFCFQEKRRRRVALATAITIGWIAGSYQMVRGVHFLSHTFFSMIASWMVIIVIYAIVNRLLPNKR